MTHDLFTSESVCSGHPDKVADQIADAVLDACLQEDKEARVSCEVLLSSGLVILAGEITTKANPNFQEIVRKVICDIGYNDSAFGFDYRSCGILTTINQQSKDIALGLKETSHKEMGAGDQGMMFGYASSETAEFMPISIMTAHNIVREIDVSRKSLLLPYLRPDGKTQVTFEFDEKGTPVHLHTIVISVQHSEDVPHGTIVKDMKELIFRTVPKNFIDSETQFFINPTGRFVLGGPAVDCGMTGRKTMVDTYGSMGRHGGGAFSGKDPTKVDRSAAYAARYVAKNIVAAGLLKRCEIQLSFAIGIPYPISIKVESFGENKPLEPILSAIIPEIFSLTPKGMIEMLQLNQPIYAKTAFGGHFGRDEFPWEKTDRVSLLKKALKF